MLQLGVNVVVLAAIYALIAAGYVIIYRVSRVLNLAHGELMMLGAYLLLTTATALPLGPIGAVLFASFLSALVGLLVYFVLMRWMTGQAVLAAGKSICSKPPCRVVPLKPMPKATSSWRRC